MDIYKLIVIIIIDIFQFHIESKIDNKPNESKIVLLTVTYTKIYGLNNMNEKPSAAGSQHSKIRLKFGQTAAKIVKFDTSRKMANT